MTTEDGVKARVVQLETLRNKQFELVYYGKYDYSATRDMTLTELDWYHMKLLETKRLEKEEHDKSLKNLQVPQVPRIRQARVVKHYRR